MAAAKESVLLGGKIDRVYIEVSSNIYKNSMGVTIPNDRADTRTQQYEVVFGIRYHCRSVKDKECLVF